MALSRSALSGLGLTGGLLFFVFSCAESEPVEIEIPDVQGGVSGSTSLPTGGITGMGGFTSTGGVVSTGGAPVTNKGGSASGGASGGKSGRGGATGMGGTSSTGGAKSAGGSAGATGGRGGAGGKANSSGGTASGGRASGGMSGTAGRGNGGVTGTAGRSSGGAAGGVSKGGSGGGDGTCDFKSTACASKQCATACPSNMGTYCETACEAVIDCIEKNPTCGTTADPMCVERKNGVASACTMEWESAGGSATPSPPAQAAQDLFECACGG